MTRGPRAKPSGLLIVISRRHACRNRTALQTQLGPKSCRFGDKPPTHCRSICPLSLFCAVERCYPPAQPASRPFRQPDRADLAAFCGVATVAVAVVGLKKITTTESLAERPENMKDGGFYACICCCSDCFSSSPLCVEESHQHWLSREEAAGCPKKWSMGTGSPPRHESTRSLVRRGVEREHVSLPQLNAEVIADVVVVPVVLPQQI